MRDFLPKEAERMRCAEQVTRDLGLLYGYREVITPVVESYDLLAARRSVTSESFGLPMSLGPLVNGPVSETCPRLSADGSLLLFSSQQPGGQGSWDLWQASVLSTPESAERNNDVTFIN